MRIASNVNLVYYCNLILGRFHTYSSVDSVRFRGEVDTFIFIWFGYRSHRTFSSEPNNVNMSHVEWAARLLDRKSEGHSQRFLVADNK